MILPKTPNLTVAFALATILLGAHSSTAAKVPFKVKRLGGVSEVGHSTSESQWAVAAIKHPTLVSWTCGPLVAERDNRRIQHATLSLTDSNNSTVVKNHSTTGAKKSHRKAVVAAKVAGVGQVRLVVTIDDPYCPAGNYVATVHINTHTAR